MEIESTCFTSIPPMPPPLLLTLPDGGASYSTSKIERMILVKLLRRMIFGAGGAADWAAPKGASGSLRIGLNVQSYLSPISAVPKLVVW